MLGEVECGVLEGVAGYPGHKEVLSSLTEREYIRNMCHQERWGACVSLYPHHQLVWTSLTLQSKVRLLETEWRSVSEIQEIGGGRVNKVSAGSSDKVKPSQLP